MFWSVWQIATLIKICEKLTLPSITTIAETKLLLLLLLLLFVVAAVVMIQRRNTDCQKTDRPRIQLVNNKLFLEAAIVQLHPVARVQTPTDATYSMLSGDRVPIQKARLLLNTVETFIQPRNKLAFCWMAK